MASSEVESISHEEPTNYQADADGYVSFQYLDKLSFNLLF